MVLLQLKAKIAAIIANSSPKGASNKEDSRDHERFPLGDENAAWITTTSGARLPIINLSYGGFATSTLASAGGPDSEQFDEATLHFLGQSVGTRIKFVHSRGSSAGYRFEHKDPKALIFMREILECLRYGSSLYELKKEFLKEKFQGDDWICLRGEGPTDIVMRLDNEGKPCEFLCTCRNGEHYNELRYYNSRFSTGVTLADQGASPRIATDHELDHDTLRLITQILLGCHNKKFAAALNPIITFAITHLSKPRS